MKLIQLIFLFILFISNCVAAEFSLVYFPNKLIAHYPPKSSHKDKEITAIIENKMMSHLIVQVIDGEDNLIKNISILPNKTGSLIFKNQSHQYFVRTIQPASGLIELVFSGDKVEIP